MTKFLIEYIGFNDQAYREVVDANSFEDVVTFIQDARKSDNTNVFKKVLKIEDVSTEVKYDS